MCIPLPVSITQQSGITDKRIEPFPSEVAAASLRTAAARARAYRTVLYWRPLVPGLNDSPEHLYLQHALGFQIHDQRHPHRPRQHGRADIGWSATETLA